MAETPLARGREKQLLSAGMCNLVGKSVCLPTPPAGKTPRYLLPRSAGETPLARGREKQLLSAGMCNLVGKSVCLPTPPAGKTPRYLLPRSAGGHNIMLISVPFLESDVYFITVDSLRVSYNVSLQEDSTMKITTHSCFLLIILLIKTLILILLRMVPSLSSTVNYTDPTLEPVVTENSVIRQKIIDSQFKCYERMNRAPPYKKKGLFCNRTWDGWLCWDDTPAGRMTAQNCPDYFPDFDPTERASKYCDETGNWFRHPESNRTWSNYTLCNSFTSEKLKMAFILYYMAIVGHALSITSLLISLAIFFYFKSLSCQRITLHKNLFFSYVLNSVFTIAHLIAVVPNPGLVKRDPLSCKVLQFFHQYMLGCNYFWMLCEGIYLHTLIVVAGFAEEQLLHWYYLLGWGFPLVPASIHAVARAKYFNDNCWMSVDTHLLYIVHGPVMAALLVNFFFLLNIVRVLVTKLRDTHRAESNMYMKAVRATLILVPLLGIQFVIIPWRPENRLAGEIYDYIMHILMHYQGLLVATIFCFFNGEVQGALKRQWTQYKTQWGQRRRDHCSTRSTSYTATSITEVPIYLYHHDSNNEQLNGRYIEDSELVALKSGETSA
nr:PREDICTED: calcitonin receptor [Opisthocomus hoazin]